MLISTMTYFLKTGEFSFRTSETGPLGAGPMCGAPSSDAARVPRGAFGEIQGLAPATRGAQQKRRGLEWKSPKNHGKTMEITQKPWEKWMLFGKVLGKSMKIPVMISTFPHFVGWNMRIFDG